MPKVNIQYHKRTDNKFYVVLGDTLIVATISFSDTASKWYVKFDGISDELHELNTKKECDTIVRQVTGDFVGRCYE